MADNKKIFQEINDIITSYKNKSIQIVDGLNYNQATTLQKIEFYWNSKYINGQTDDIGRTKPFYNISKFRVNVATRATDLDVKDVRITSDNPSDRVRSLILNKETYNWMKESDFSKVLNDFGKNRAKYGGALIKKCIEDGELEIEVVEWKNTITDQVQIDEGVIIETHYMSPSELSKKRGVWENVEEAMDLATKKRSGRGDTSATEKKVPIYEVHGEFPETLDPQVEDGDDKTYKKMMFIIAGDPEDKQILLWSEEEKESPYKYLAWDSIPGRGLGMGIVEDGFEAQMWTNDAVMAEKNVMDLVGKVFIKTNSKQLGNNVLNEAENGQIFELEDGADANVMQLAPSSLPQFANVVDKWNIQYERATNTFDAVTGETLPSGTPLGSTAIQAAQASSFFDYRREEAGIFWTEVFMDWILPFLIKKLSKQHILTSDYSNEELAMIDRAFSAYSANREVINNLLEGKVTTQQDYDQAVLSYQELQKVNGKRRFLDIPDNYFKGFEAKVTIDMTGETKNKSAVLQSLFTVLSQIASNPAILQDPNLLSVFNEMLEMSGLNFMPLTVQPTQQPAGKTSKGEVPQQSTAVENTTQSVLPQAQQA